MMRPTPWPDWLDGVWAKSPDKGAANGESLAAHTWSVAERLADLRAMRPGLEDRLGIPGLWAGLFWAVMLHDTGKCAAGFQAMLRGERTTALARAWKGHRHEVFSLAFVDAIAPAGNPFREWIIAGIVSHHRDQAQIAACYDPINDDDQLGVTWSSVDPEHVKGIARWLAECGPAWATALGIPEAAALLVDRARAESARALGPRRIRVALDQFDRYVASPRSHMLRVPGILLRGLITQADRSASAHVGKIRPLATSADELRARWSGIKRYETHQQEAAVTTGSALLMAPTGTGKTEAALLWAARQADAPRLFYTLPYQASMNAMCGRLEETFGKGGIGLAHGRALLALYRLIGEEEPDRERQARRRMNLARLHHLPIQICSPYQMLKAMYRLKGYEGLLTDYDGAAFIFDEIHAYEPNRLALIVETLRYLRESHRARFLVMSATLPGLIGSRLAEALGEPPLISAAPELYARTSRHRIRVREGELFDPPNWANIVAAIRSGRSVLVCANTVARAQRAKALLRVDFPELEIPLLHGRLNGRDRLAREALVRDATGSNSPNRRPIALVATQTVEVSLDIDLDTIYTDPAPLEALIQRFGRVNRRGRQAGLADVHVFRRPDDGQHIYDAGLVQAGLAILQRENGNPLREDAVGAWLDEVYAGPPGVDWVARYETAAAGFRSAIVNSLVAFNSEDRLEEQFYAAFDGLDALPAQFEAEYQQLREEEPLAAQELFVSIGTGYYARLKKAGRIRRAAFPVIIDVPYEAGDDGIGLDLSVLSQP